MRFILKLFFPLASAWRYVRRALIPAVVAGVFTYNALRSSKIEKLQAEVKHLKAKEIAYAIRDDPIPTDRQYVLDRM